MIQQIAHQSPCNTDRLFEWRCKANASGEEKGHLFSGDFGGFLAQRMGPEKRKEWTHQKCVLTQVVMLYQFVSKK